MPSEVSLGKQIQIVDTNGNDQFDPGTDLIRSAQEDGTPTAVSIPENDPRVQGILSDLHLSSLTQIKSLKAAEKYLGKLEVARGLADEGKVGLLQTEVSLDLPGLAEDAGSSFTHWDREGLMRTALIRGADHLFFEARSSFMQEARDGANLDQISYNLKKVGTYADWVQSDYKVDLGYLKRQADRLAAEVRKTVRPTPYSDRPAVAGEQYRHVIVYMAGHDPRAAGGGIRKYELSIDPDQNYRLKRTFIAQEGDRSEGVQEGNLSTTPDFQRRLIDQLNTIGDEDQKQTVLEHTWNHATHDWVRRPEPSLFRASVAINASKETPPPPEGVIFSPAPEK